MMDWRLAILAKVLLLLVLPIGALATYTRRQTGLFYNDGATKGLTLFAPFRGIGTYLIRNDGKVVKSWEEPDGLTPGASVYLTKEGTLLRAIRSEGTQGDGGRIREYDAKGNCIWELRFDAQSDPPAPGQQHHDFEVLPNGNILFTAREGPDDTILEVKRRNVNRPAGELNKDCCVAGGGSFDNTCQCVVDGASDSFEPVWFWSSADHRGKNDPRKIDSDKIPVVNFNHIDYLPRRGHILLSCNACNEIFIIDHKTSTDEAALRKGDLLWRWGSPQNYGAPGDAVLGFTHGVHWIYNYDSYGWSGFSKKDVGDIILFNNRDPELCGDKCISGSGTEGLSSLVKLSPPWNGRNYGDPSPGEAFGPKEEDLRIKQFKHRGWTYDIDSDFQGSAQFLPNRRIMMCIGAVNNNDSTNRAQGDIYELLPYYHCYDHHHHRPNRRMTSSGRCYQRYYRHTAISKWRYVNPFVPPVDFTNEDGVRPNNGPKPPDVKLRPYEKVEVCDERGVGGFDCNCLFRAIKYSPKFKGLAVIHCKPRGGCSQHADCCSGVCKRRKIKEDGRIKMKRWCKKIQKYH